jgi:DNA polymerase III subunit epsilon
MVAIERSDLAQMSDHPAALGDVVDFLRACAPLHVVAETDVECAAAFTEVEFFLAGTAIFAQGSRSSEHLRVIRTGTVEIAHEDRVLDLLGPGELLSSHGATLAGLAPGFTARAREDTLCYRIPEDVATAARRRHGWPERTGRQPGSAGAGAYKRTRLPRGRTPWREASYCAVDLELSGLDPKRHEILSYGAIPIEDGRVKLGAAVHGRVRPQRAISEASIRIHGMRASDLEDAPPLPAAIDPLLAAMAGRIPVVHVAVIERSFLRPALRGIGLRLRRPMIDTSMLGPVWLQVRDGHGPRHMPLGALVQALGLPSHRPHDALGDALTTAQAFVALATHLDACRPETVRSLSSAGRRLELLPPQRCL